MSRLSIAAVLLVLSTGLVLAQGSGGGSGSAGGAPAGRAGGTTAPGAGPATQGGSPGARSIGPNTPAQPAPGVANTPADPARNNVDVNPPTSNQPTSPHQTPTASPSDRIDQPGGASSGRAATRPGAAQGTNSDGYAECMAMWSPANTRMSQQEWTKTCDNARLKQR
jgi:hypothetical protein